MVGTLVMYIVKFFCNTVKRTNARPKRLIQKNHAELKNHGIFKLQFQIRSYSEVINTADSKQKSVLTSKKISESAVYENIYKVFPNDLNSYGTVFGGMVMSELDRIASVVAERHSGHTCVTASVDAMHFLGPAGQGDILLFYASVNRSWHTSMEIGAKVLADNFKTGEHRHIISAYFTFVALDENKKPTDVPQITLETPIEKRRHTEAGERRELRRKEKEDRHLSRQTYGL